MDLSLRVRNMLSDFSADVSNAGGSIYPVPDVLGYYRRRRFASISTLIARAAPKELLGSLLIISVCIGFALTIASIELTSYLLTSIRPENIFLTIVIGPALGLFFLFPLIRNKHQQA